MKSIENFAQSVKNAGIIGIAKIQNLLKFQNVYIEGKSSLYIKKTIN